MISKDEDAMALMGFVFNNELCPKNAQTSLYPNIYASIYRLMIPLDMTLMLMQYIPITSC